ncbi:phage portal protein (plasmid) [Agrobacterium rosae]|uniref:Phage portal protein n=1 Tax=Agrobacterium rosae TaxID=1972867 RepID=A0ABU4W879_9HYPH|nr:phage portal protein [Agrobacterium rosae]MDX8332852.1 phage portal protein [Agrobacterium rosae]
MARTKKRSGSVPSNMTREQQVEKARRLDLKDGMSWAGAFGTNNHAGKSVTINTAMQLATVWSCIRLTAQAVSCLPLAIYEKRGNDRVKVDADDDLVDVLCESPNADQTPLEFWETKVAWMMATGNAYSEKVEIGSRVTALQPLPSTHCHPFRDADGDLHYTVNDRGKTEVLPRDKVFHLKGFGFGGDMGLSPIQFGSQTFGSAIAIDEAAGKLFGKGLQASGVLSSDKMLDEKQRVALAAIMEKFIGSSNAGKLMILEAGLKYDRLSLSPVDAQMLENKRFSVEEICRWFGVPPIIIGHAAQGQTMWGSGVEQLLLGWLTLGINPLCSRIEERIKKQLIRPTGNRRRYAEFNREALLQMDSAAKAAFLSTMTQNGLMTRNEGRAKLNLPRVDGGDDLTAQTNLAPLSALGSASDGNAARAAMRAFLQIESEKVAA